MIDTTTLFGEWLHEPGSDLYTLCGTRAWSPVAAPGYKNEQPAIIFHLESEPMHVSAATILSRFICKCYGGTARYTDARTVYRELTNKVHLQSNTARGILRAEHVTGGQTMPDGDTGWPVVLARVNVLFAGQ